MLNPTQKSFRISKLTPAHQSINTLLSASPQSLASLAAAAGVSQDLAEKQLSVLIDEGLCSRTSGSRTTAAYAAA